MTSPLSAPDDKHNIYVSCCLIQAMDSDSTRKGSYQLNNIDIAHSVKIYLIFNLYTYIKTGIPRENWVHK